MTSPDPQGAVPVRSGPSWHDLGPRLLSAAVIVAVIATGLYFGGYVFAILAAIVFGITYREWEQMVTLKPLAPLGMAMLGLLALAAVAYPTFGWLGVIALIAIALLVATFGDKAVLPWRIGGLVFFGVVLIAVLAMRGYGPAGVVAGWYLGIVIAFNDTGAYFVGRVIGGPKLAPAISPAKTWAGSIGGWVIGTLAGSAITATTAAATGPFMSVVPSPCITPSLSTRADHGSSCQPVSGTVSMWPENARPPFGPRCATRHRFATPASST